jgi:hypothetical protein
MSSEVETSLDIDFTAPATEIVRDSSTKLGMTELVMEVLSAASSSKSKLRRELFGQLRERRD